MQCRSWVWVLVVLLLGGSLQGQERVGARLGIGGEWSTIPARIDQEGVAEGLWGMVATLEFMHSAIPRLAFLARVGHAPEQLSPAAPLMTTLGGGIRLELLNRGHLTAGASLEVEAVCFSAAAYMEAAAGSGLPRRRDMEYNYTGWRGGVRLSPALELWPTSALGLRFAPALRWLGPVGGGGPPNNAAYVTANLGVLLRLWP
jgi:hypothetical protein